MSDDTTTYLYRSLYVESVHDILGCKPYSSASVNKKSYIFFDHRTIDVGINDRCLFVQQLLHGEASHLSGINGYLVC